MSIMTEEWTTTQSTQPELAPSPATGRHTAAKWATLLILIGSLFLIFAQLGHYPLWDDEAITAMTGRGVWRTGDTSAWVDDHNLLAYRNGLLINHFADRYTPPLQFYLLAPFMGLLGESAWICRLPFAICGMIGIGILLRWMWRINPKPIVWWSAAFLILTNASFFLFQRQCRYYALATMLTVAVAYLYWNWNAGRRSVWPLSIALAALLAAQYLNYAAAVGCLMFDYGLWGRKRRVIRRRDWLVLIIPQLIVGAVVCSIWNPVERAAATLIEHATTASTIVATPAVAASVPKLQHYTEWLRGFLELYWWNWRDMLASDFILLPLLFLCPLLYLKRKNTWMLRAPAALFVYLAIVAAFTAHPGIEVGNAEIRYLAPVLPLCFAISILAIYGITAMKRGSMIAAFSLAAFSMFIEPADNNSGVTLGSTSLMFYHELWHPQEEPFSPTIAWIQSHVKKGESIYIKPDWMTYPIMFKAGDPTYAWQLSDPPKPEYAKLPDIHFAGRVAPDYLIAFGPFADNMADIRDQLAKRGYTYNQIDTLHTYWKDQYRPERIWRAFVSPEPKPGEEIYIYRRSGKR
jgi:hypothetical protein